ncbi:hypothetical protein BGX24_011850 [Mortierella sp. AD032]|nr:hypothetical protein BGX24_011850 [Mortierella sp. AD032]
MDMDIDTTTSAATMARTKSAKATAQATSTETTPTVLTRLCDAQSEHFYIYLTIYLINNKYTHGNRNSNIHLLCNNSSIRSIEVSRPRRKPALELVNFVQYAGG